MIDDETPTESDLTEEDLKAFYIIKKSLYNYVDGLYEKGISYGVSASAMLQVCLMLSREGKLEPEKEKDWIISNWEYINEQEW